MTGRARYAAAGALAILSLVGAQPASAAATSDDPTSLKPENIPRVQTARPIPIPTYVQDGGPWATARPRSRTVNLLPGEGFVFCRAGAPHLMTICKEMHDFLSRLPHA